MRTKSVIIFAVLAICFAAVLQAQYDQEEFYSPSTLSSSALDQESEFYSGEFSSPTEASYDEDLPALPLGFEDDENSGSEDSSAAAPQSVPLTLDNIEEFESSSEDAFAESAANTLARGSRGGSRGGLRGGSSSSSRSSSLRGSSSSSSRSSSGLRGGSKPATKTTTSLRSSGGSVKSSSSGLGTKSSSSSTKTKTSTSTKSKTTTKKVVAYTKVKISYTKFKTRYPTIFVYSRPSTYVYGGLTYNTFSKYTFMGEYNLDDILRIIGRAPYVRRTMKIRYMTSTLGYVYLWRNVVIDMSNGNVYVIRADSTAGKTVILTAIMGNVNNSTSNSTTTASTTPASAASTSGTTTVTGTAKAAATLEYYMEDAAEVMQATPATTSSSTSNLSPSATATIEPTPTGATPDTSDTSSQNDFKAADALAQDQLSVMTVPVYAGATRTMMSIVAVIVMAAAWLFAL